MTDQVQDSVRYDGESYSLVNASPDLFSPWRHGIEPEYASTDNQAGYIAYYHIEKNTESTHIQLSALMVAYTAPTRRDLALAKDDPLSAIMFTKSPLPTLNGVSATKADSGYWFYEAIDLALDYTGTLTLEASTNPASHCLALVFEHGKLISTESIPKPDYF